LAGTELYSVITVIEARVCERLARSRYVNGDSERPGISRRPLDCNFDVLSITPLRRVSGFYPEYSGRGVMGKERVGGIEVPHRGPEAALPSCRYNVILCL